MTINDLIAALATVEISRENAQIERACEAALQGGEHGVFVRRTATGRLLSAGVHRHVPYGHIYESRFGEPDWQADGAGR